MARPKTYDRDTVTRKALERFWSLGFEATSMSDLSASTGLNKKSLYNEFGDKEGLFQAALSLYIDDRHRQASATLGHQPLGAENLRAFFHHFGDGLDPRGCLIALSLNEIETVSPKTRQQIDAVLGFLFDLFRRNLAAAKPEAKPETLDNEANYLVVLMQGLTTVARIADDPSHLSKQGRVGLRAVLPTP